MIWHSGFRGSKRRTALSVACALTLLGCNPKDSRGVRREPPEVACGTATISGRVRISGVAPEMKLIDNHLCHPNAKPIHEETVIVDAAGGLANVFVYLEGGPHVDGSSLPPAQLDQVDCRYVPHVVGVTARQPLIVKSSDPTLHNTVFTPTENPADNFALRDAGHQKTISFDGPEIFPVKCDVHPWMLAYIGVFDNPFFAVTKATGDYSIASVPAGRYTLVAWHELYGTLKQEITIANGASAEIDFEYKPPKKK